MNRTSTSRLFRRLLAGAAVFAAIATAFGADGDLRKGTPDIIDSTSKAPHVASSIAVADDGTLYVTVTYDAGADGGALYALVPTADGLQRKWAKPLVLPLSVEASPTIGRDGMLYFGADDGVFYAVDRNSGAVQRTFRTDALSPGNSIFFESTAALSADGKTLYVGVEIWNDSVSPVGGGLLALPTSLEKPVWFVPLPDEVASSPAIGADGTIYVGTRNKGVLYAVTPAGMIKWQREIGNEMLASPAIGRDGTIYIGSLTQFLAITPDNRTKWEKHDVVTRVTAAVAADDTVYVANYLNWSLDAYRGSNGDLRWRYGPRVEPSLSPPLVRADGTVIYAGFDTRIRALDPGGTIHSRAPGTVLWEQATANRSPFDGSPVVSPVDNSIWIAARNGAIFGVGGEYPLSQYASWPMFQHDAAHTGIAPARAGGGRLVNLSSRAEAGPGLPFIAGLYAAGSDAKTVLVRGVGPALGVFGIANAMTDPLLSVHINPYVTPLPNDNWEQADDPTLTASLTAAVGAFPLRHGSKDAAMVMQVDPKLAAGGGQYSITIDSVDGKPGVALTEIYDADAFDAPTRLVNLSTRAFVGTGENVLIAGFMIRGGSLPLLIRGVGPALSKFQVGDVLQRPVVTVQDRDGRVLATNQGWATNHDPSPFDIQFVSAAVGAFGLPPNSADSALIVTLEPDQLYTIKVTGDGNTTGNAIVEIYDLSFQ